MSRKQYTPPSQTHSKKQTRREQKTELAEQRKKYEEQKAEQDAQQVETDTSLPMPTEEDKAQLRKLATWSAVGILVLLALMYWTFVSGN